MHNKTRYLFRRSIVFQENYTFLLQKVNDCYGTSKRHYPNNKKGCERTRQFYDVYPTRGSAQIGASNPNKYWLLLLAPLALQRGCFCM